MRASLPDGGTATESKIAPAQRAPALQRFQYEGSSRAKKLSSSSRPRIMPTLQTQIWKSVSTA